MRRILLLVIVLCIAAVGAVKFSQAQDNDGPKKKPKNSIKEVMKEAHKDGLLKKVMDGSATREEKDKLLDLYISMHDNEPPKGEKNEWLMRSGWLVVAAARASLGREEATDALKEASNCKACHTVHK
jgi:hypothetical protein